MQDKNINLEVVDENDILHGENCMCEADEVIMDKLASVSYIAMLSVVAYGLLAISTLMIA